MEGKQMQKHMYVQASTHLWLDGTKGSQSVTKQMRFSAGSDTVEMQVLGATAAAEQILEEEDDMLVEGTYCCDRVFGNESMQIGIFENCVQMDV